MEMVLEKKSMEMEMVGARNIDIRAANAVSIPQNGRRKIVFYWNILASKLSRCGLSEDL